ncbi:MAG: hypothetical protein LBK66_08515 [Spirochaetaceae bacterium]|jgi:hypothetical protein|nr:hypothetical protein [Spirochaetaceae bacterium]
MAVYDDYKNYVTEADFVALTKFACLTPQSPKYALTFREAGENTITRLNQGAGAKPHDILEKTVKPNGPNIPQIPAGINYDDVKGFVGHWQGTDVLLGIYLTTYGAKVFHDRLGVLIQSVEKPSGKKRFILNLRNTSITGEAAMSIVKEIPKWESCFFTGDYDLHDSLEKAGGWKHLIEGAHGHVTFFNKINHALLSDPGNQSPDEAKEEYKANTELAGAKCLESDYQRIQHGAQFGYIAYMLNHEVKKGTVEINSGEITIDDILNHEAKKGTVEIVEKVAKASFPLAACIGKDDGTEWRIIKNHNDYVKFYKYLGPKVKVPWQSDHEFSAFMTRLGETYNVP